MLGAAITSRATRSRDREREGRDRLGSGCAAKCCAACCKMRGTSVAASVRVKAARTVYSLHSSAAAADDDDDDDASSCAAANIIKQHDGSAPFPQLSSPSPSASPSPSPSLPLQLRSSCPTKAATFKKSDLAETRTPNRKPQTLIQTAKPNLERHQQWPAQVQRIACRRSTAALPVSV